MKEIKFLNQQIDTKEQPVFYLKREYGDRITKGVLTFDPAILKVDEDYEIFNSKVLELPWRDNTQRESCIPEGIFPLAKHEGSGLQFDGRVKVKKVKGRSAIIIHEGNTIKDTLGCPLLGIRFKKNSLKSSLIKVVEFTELVYELIGDGYTPYLHIHSNKIANNGHEDI